MSYKDALNEKGIIMHHPKCAKEIQKRLVMVTCKTVATPADMNLKSEDYLDEEKVESTKFKQTVGSLEYLCNSKPDLSCAVSVLSELINNPRRSHYMTSKRVMRCVQRTIQEGIEFHKDTGQNCGELIAFSDTNWCGERTDRRSTSRYLFKLLGVDVSWCIKKQPVTALSTYKAEYIAGLFTACQAIWLYSFLKELRYDVMTKFFKNNRFGKIRRVVGDACF